jgi:hypothetical protein
LCKRHTHHNLVASHPYDNRGEEDCGEDYGEFRMWCCAGCDVCTMEDYYTTSDKYSISNGNEVSQHYDSIYYPKLAVGHRPEKQFHKLPTKLANLYHEVINAHNDNLHILCSAGLRGLIEGICADKNITGHNLEKKIDNMTTVLPSNIVENLHAFRFIGNDAVHELQAPPEYALSVAFDVIEDILNFLYALNYKADLLEKLKGKQTRVKAPDEP